MKGTVDSPIFWSVPDSEPDNVDVVFVGNSDGARCTQSYSGNARSGFAGAGTKTNKNAILLACTDNYSEPEPPALPVAPKPPIIGENCDSDEDTSAFQKAIDNNPNYDWVIAGGRNKESGGEGNTAICVDRFNGDTDGNGKITRCVSRCVTPPTGSDVPWFAPGSDDYIEYCGGDGPFFPIECRACALSTEVVSDYFDPETQFCWEQAQKAEVGSNKFANGSFKLPPPEQGRQAWDIKGRKGSYCYLISGQTQSGWPYAYWVPSNCPD